MIKKILNSAIFNTWIANGVFLLNALIIIPVVVSALPVEEANIWFLLTSIMSMSQAIAFGFNGTFTRFIAYSYGGVRIKDFNNIKNVVEHKERTTYSKVELSRIFLLMKQIYLALSLVFTIFITAISYFSLLKLVEDIQDPNIVWMSMAVMVLCTSSAFFLGFNRVFLEGLGQVTKVQRLFGISQVMGFALVLLVIIVMPNLFTIIFVYQLIHLTAFVLYFLFANREKKKLGLKKLKIGFDKDLFKKVWGGAWKTGSTTIIANLILHFSSILVSQWTRPEVSASFLFTKRMFDVIERFTNLTFLARVPKIARLRGQGNIDQVVPVIKQSQYFSFGVFVIGYSTLLFFGRQVVELIGSNVALLPFEVIFVLSFASLFSRWGGMMLIISNQANHVVEHLNAILTGAIYFAFVFILRMSIGVVVFPLSQLIALLGGVPLLAINIYKRFKTNFLQYEKTMLFPMILLVLTINLVYWSIFT